MLGQMKLRDLELVRIVCAAGGFSNAARQLGTTQPTLSKSIARLEQELGVSLFDRADGNARPTMFGRLVADRAASVLSAVSSLERELKQWTQGNAGQLRIVVGSATRRRPLPQVLDYLSRNHPGLRIEVKIESGAAIADGIAKGRYDVAFSYAGNALEFGDLLRIKLFSDRRVFAMRPDHPLATTKEISLEDFLTYPVAGLGVTPALRQLLGTLTDKQDQNLHAFAADDSDLVCDKLSASNFVASGPSFLFESYVRRGLLIMRSAHALPDLDYWMLTTTDSWKSPIIRNVAEAAKITPRSHTLIDASMGAMEAL